MTSAKHKILFVCLGNICRSPAAEAVMEHIVRSEGRSEEYEIDSAGTYAGHRGELADARMRRAAAARGYELLSRSRPVCGDDFERFDMIVAMDDSNYERLYRLAPSVETSRKIFRMVEFCRDHPEATHVPDPYYEGAEGFEIVLDLLEDACYGLYEYTCGETL